MVDLAEWLKQRRVTEVECMVPDLAGIARGKITPTQKFLANVRDGALRLPESVFAQTVTGAFVDTEVMDETEPDMVLHPDPASIALVPWYGEPTAQVICDCHYRDGKPVPYAPRQVLRAVLDLYAARGWCPVVAAEVEFYLVAKNLDPDYPLEPPVGRSGRPETGRQSYGIDAVNEFDPLFEEMYDFCEAQELDIDTLIHEAGAAQVEINFNHGDALRMADQVFFFKRTLRHVAIRHDVYATFMAKPIASEPGSAMHIHQSVEDGKGRNLFANRAGGNTRLFESHIGGLQKYLPAAAPLLLPNVNSYRRLVPNTAAPMNLYWGLENRTAGLRVPESGANSRRIENRVPGADCNPYLAIAGSLACGYLGMMEKLKPSKPSQRNVYERRQYALPRYLPDALAKLKSSTPLNEILGEDFVTLLLDVKQEENDGYQNVISAWEREHLLLNV
ncbi:MAG: glutamine synthetase family protein [Alphaproteobacteria bacterium]